MRRSDLVAGVVAAASSRPAPDGMTTRIIAIDGPGGAGKSTFADILAAALSGAQIVRTDDFASWDNPLDWWPRLVQDVLDPLSRNLPARYQCSVWSPQLHPTWKTLQPAAFMVLEGVTATREAFQPYLTYSIWIETSRELRLRRGLDRDGEGARPQWEKWMADEDAYVQREMPRERADLVLHGDRDLWR